MINEPMYKRYLHRIEGRMMAEHAKDISDEEIERTLKDCVAGDRLILWAKQAKADGVLCIQAEETKVFEAEALRTPPNPKGSGIRAGDLL